MKFEIERTSKYSTEFDEDKKPHPSATPEDFLRPDIRTQDSPKNIPINKGKGGDWYTVGQNHRVENGCIVRDFPDTHWVIEIESLQDLISFSKEQGSIIIHPPLTQEGIPRLEIYDDYRE